MNAKAGIVTSQAAWLASLPVTAGTATGFDYRGAATGFVVAGVFSFWPDLEHEGSTAGRAVGKRWSWLIRKIAGGHRMGTHSVFAVIVIAWWLVGYFTQNPTMANAAAVGWFSHIFTDLLTVQGVGLLWPLTRRKFRIGWMVTGRAGETWYIRLVTLMAVITCFLYVQEYLDSIGVFAA